MKPKRKLNNIDNETINKKRKVIITSSSSSSSSESDEESEYIISENISENISESSETSFNTNETKSDSNNSETIVEYKSDSETIRYRSESTSVSRSSNTDNDTYCDINNDIEENKEFLDSKTLKKLKIQNPILYNKFKEVFEEVKNNEPNIINIVSKNLQLKDKAKLFQLFEIYRNSIPHTHDWLETRNIINKKLKDAIRNQTEYDRYTEEEHKNMETQICNLEKNISNNTLQIKYKILNLETTEENKIVIYRKFVELQSIDKNDTEYSKLFNWINNAIELPFDRIKRFSIDDKITNFLRFAYSKMDDELFGMKKVKEQLIFFINSKLTNPNMKKTNLGLVGPPGVGKTSIARLLSTILDIGFQQISCGGIDRSDFFKGHDYTYVGSRPGEIVNCLKRMKTKNGILFFDEYEKVLSNKSISSLMLHITDPSQNFEFRDNYFSELTIDLSHIWFIYSMNSLPNDEALRDRIFYIEIEGYTYNEKVMIIKNYILKKTLKNTGLKETDIVFKIDAIKHLINLCGKNEKGVRTLEKVIMDIVNKFKFLEMHQDINGNLPFDLSFKINKKINFPLEVDINILNKIIQIEKSNENNIINSLYI